MYFPAILLSLCAILVLSLPQQSSFEAGPPPAGMDVITITDPPHHLVRRDVHAVPDMDAILIQDDVFMSMVAWDNLHDTMDRVVVSRIEVDEGTMFTDEDEDEAVHLEAFTLSYG